MKIGYDRRHSGEDMPLILLHETTTTTANDANASMDQLNTFHFNFNVDRSDHFACFDDFEHKMVRDRK